MNISTKEWFTILSVVQSLKTDCGVQGGQLSDLIDILHHSGALSDQDMSDLNDKAELRRKSLELEEPATEHEIAPKTGFLTDTGVVALPAQTSKDMLEPAFASLLDRAYFEMCNESGEKGN